MMDWMAKSGSPEGRGPGSPPQPPATGGGGGDGRKPKNQTLCRFGKNCSHLNDKNVNKCDFMHPPQRMSQRQMQNAYRSQQNHREVRGSKAQEKAKEKEKSLGVLFAAN